MATIDTKICQKCEIIKKFLYFDKDKSVKDGYRNKCKECVKIELKEKQIKFLSENTAKKCTGKYGCGEIKEFSEFNQDSSTQTGLEHTCRECKSIYNKNKFISKEFKNKQLEFQKNNPNIQCIKCGNKKTINEFRKKSESTTGYSSICKNCYLQIEHSKEYKENIINLQQEFKQNNIEKLCPTCGDILLLNNFDIDNHSTIGYHSECKKCTKSRREKRKLSYTQKSQKEYRDKFLTKKCTGCNKIKLRTIECFNQNAGREDGLNDYCKECQSNAISKYRQTLESKLKAAIYMKEKRNNNIQFKIRCNVSAMICNRLKKRLASKEGKSTFDILPYTIEDIMSHLENQFQDGMSWDNYGVGKDKWEIDHMTPDSWFNYESIEDEDFLKSWSLENLQPMWCFDNRSKSNRFASNEQELIEN